MATKTNTSAPYAAQATSWWTPLKPESLRLRLALLAALLLALIQLLFSLIFYTFTSNWLLYQVDQSLSATAAQVAASIQDEDEPLEREDLEFRLNVDDVTAAVLLQERQFFIRGVDLDSGAIISQNAMAHVPVTARARENAAFETLTLDGMAAPLRVYSLRLENNAPYALQVGQSLADIQRTQAQILRLSLLMLMAAGILALVTGWFLANRALSPVSAIARTAQAIGEQDLSQRTDTPLPDDELGQLARTLNRMLDRIESAFQRQRQFTGDAAHELRTPLSIMQTGLDVALSQPRSVENYRSVLENMREEVLRLTQLTTSLLMLARADAHTLSIERHRVNLSLLLETVVDQVALAAEQKHIRIGCDIPPNIQTNADEDRLIQLALNLLENAVKYTPEHGSIQVKLAADKNQVCFSVRDSGIGIPPQHLPYIFDRFYRADRARNRQHGGFGLGLAIAQQIAQLHGGDIRVTSDIGAGSEFMVTLPIS
jgi:heavy metal sensor kinase